MTTRQKHKWTKAQIEKQREHGRRGGTQKGINHRRRITETTFNKQLERELRDITRKMDTNPVGFLRSIGIAENQIAGTIQQYKEGKEKQQQIALQQAITTEHPEWAAVLALIKQNEEKKQQPRKGDF